MYRPYAGIGSRKTPPDIVAMMTCFAYHLALQGYTVRTGGADEADRAFEQGALQAATMGAPTPEVYLPWRSFNHNPSPLYPPPAKAYTIAARYHPDWDQIDRDAVRALMARNAQQILGWDLDHPSHFVHCWTPDGCIHHATRTYKTGGTGQAISHASDLGIPIFNWQRPDHYERIQTFLSSKSDLCFPPLPVSSFPTST